MSKTPRLKSISSSLESILLILKLVIPFYLLADILIYFNLLKKITFIFEPITNFLNLPQEATLALAAGMLFNLYAAIAFASPLDLSPYQWTVLALFLGIAHSLLVESAIMKKLGIPLTYSTLLRILTAFLAIIPLGYLPHTVFTNTSIVANKVTNMRFDSFYSMFSHSLQEAIILSIKITILVVIMIFIMDYIKSLKLLQQWQSKVRTSFSLITGLILGITYGASILINESKSNSLSKKEIFYIGTFLMLCHAIIEDTLLFVIFGANGYVVITIRLVIATILSYLLLKFYKE